MSIVVGGAHSASYGSEVPGDQGQTSIPDVSVRGQGHAGEVSMVEYTTESEFISRFEGWQILRPIDAEDAGRCAQAMITACNNAHIGYLLGGTGMTCQGGSNRTDTSTDCRTDCSGLVCQCFTEGTGISMYTSTHYMKDTCVQSGKISYQGTFVSYVATPVYNGDALVNPGHHTEMVVQGNPRTGTEDEILTRYSTSAGDGEPAIITTATTSSVIAVREGYKLETTFTPRRIDPDIDDHAEKQYYNQNYGATKNGSYAWGRFSEIMKSECDVSRGEPRRWYLNKEDGYKRAMAPSVGAIMCFTNIYDKTSPGFVSVVESIDGNVLYVSQRDLETGKFEYVKRVKRDGSWDIDINKDGVKEFVFQGFILNPVVDPDYALSRTRLQSFLSAAMMHEGDDITFAQQYGGVQGDNAWSAGFIRAVAARSGGILGTIVPDTLSCSAIGLIGVRDNMGTWLDGPCLGGYPNTQLGDIALFRTRPNKEYGLKYSADKAGIVVKADNLNPVKYKGRVRYKFKVIMGDCEGTVKIKVYWSDANSFLGLFRPDWDRVDSIALAPEKMLSLYGMYIEQSSIQDAAVRDLKYLVPTEKGFKPSIKSGTVKLCAINYTGMLANFYGAFSEMSEYMQRREDQSNYVTIISNRATSLTDEQLMQTVGNTPVTFNTTTNVVISGPGSVTVNNTTITVDDTFKVIYSSLRDFLGNGAGAIGVMGNMYQESRFVTSAKNKFGFIGLCQWDPKYRGVWMKATCLAYNGRTWENNLEGQLKYLFDELDGTVSSDLWSNTAGGWNVNYKKVRDICKAVPQSLEGAYQASDSFLKDFESPNGIEQEIPLRREWAAGIWKLING